GRGDLPHRVGPQPRWHHHLPGRAERPHGAADRASFLPDGTGARDVLRQPRTACRRRGDPARLSGNAPGRLNTQGPRMIDFVQNTIDGVMIGSSYALLALGFTLIFGVMRRLNLSYGPSIMIGAYLGTLMYVQLSAGPLVVVAATVVGAVLAGIYVERLCFAPMAAGAGVASMVSSFAIWMQLEQAAILVLPRHTYPFPPLSTAAPLTLGPFLLRVDHLIMLACAIVLSAGVHLVIYRSRFGLALRAIIGNPVAAHLVGIDVRAMMPLAFAGASAVGG